MEPSADVDDGDRPLGARERLDRREDERPPARAGSARDHRERTEPADPLVESRDAGGEEATRRPVGRHLGEVTAESSDRSSAFVVHI